VKVVEFLKIFNYNHFSDQLFKKIWYAEGELWTSREAALHRLAESLLGFGTLVPRLHDAAAPFSRIIGVAWNIS
jgi:hypothetical protein